MSKIESMNSNIYHLPSTAKYLDAIMDKNIPDTQLNDDLISKIPKSVDVPYSPPEEMEIGPNIGVIALYILLTAITWKYIPLYAKQGVKDYNDRMVIGDAMILITLPFVGTYGLVKIFIFLRKLIRRFC